MDDTNPADPPRSGRQLRVHLPERGVVRILDDGYRFWLFPEGIVGAEWEPWAEYKHYNLPGVGYQLVELIWLGLRAMGGEEVDAIVTMDRHEYHDDGTGRCLCGLNQDRSVHEVGP